MGCSCRKNRPATTGGPVGSVTGYRYTPPPGVEGESVVYLTVLEARSAQMRNGGGTIKTERAKG